jgi:RNA polymerase sigma-70 factor (ECF subfamily)
LAQRFEAHRDHLRAVAYRMLGSRREADDAVQESWLRLGNSDEVPAENLGGWLTAVVARVCLDTLRTRPGQGAGLADSVSVALLVVLETLAPAERLAFVLRDLLAMPFEEIAPIVGGTPIAAQELARRARRRVHSGSAAGAADPARQRELVAALLAAARGGDVGGLLAVLDPDVVLRADAAAVRARAPQEVLGAAAVAEVIAGRARSARAALVDGLPAAVRAPAGEPRVVFSFVVVGGRIAAIDMTTDLLRLRDQSITIVDR